MDGTTRWLGGWIAAAVLCVFSLAGPAAAEKIQQWKDDKGRTHFSNVGPSDGEGAPTSAAPAETVPGTGDEGKKSGDGKDAKKGPYADLSDESFSGLVSRERSRLRRELQEEKRKIAEIDEKIEELRRARTASLAKALEGLGGVKNPDEVKGPEEQDLEKVKKKSEERIEEIRKQYDELRDEAVKRYGGQPSWWLPLEKS